MNIIFLDIDGVLNYKKYDYEHMRDYNDLGVDVEKVRILAKICKITNSKVVLSSSWKLSYSKYEIPECLYRLAELFYNEGVPLYGLTPNIPNEERPHGQEMWKEWDIQVYLYEHKEVKAFCVIDDEDYDLKTLKENLVKTKWSFNEQGDGGLTEYHLPQISRCLNLKNANKYQK